MNGFSLLTHIHAPIKLHDLQTCVLSGRCMCVCAGGHYMNGPIYVCGAEPGDVLEVLLLCPAPLHGPYSLTCTYAACTMLSSLPGPVSVLSRQCRIIHAEVVSGKSSESIQDVSAGTNLGPAAPPQPTERVLWNHHSRVHRMVEQDRVLKPLGTNPPAPVQLFTRYAH